MENARRCHATVVTDRREPIQVLTQPLQTRKNKQATHTPLIE